MVMSPTGFGNKNDCAGEGQQQFTQRTDRWKQWRNSISVTGLLKQIPLILSSILTHVMRWEDRETWEGSWRFIRSLFKGMLMPSEFHLMYRRKFREFRFKVCSFSSRHCAFSGCGWSRGISYIDSRFGCSHRHSIRGGPPAWRFEGN
jgi:hypothetical protein